MHRPILPRKQGFTLIDSRAVKRGFTLIEISIVLVIIGLIVGGVLVGKELIKAAEIRNAVKQFEEYNTAVNTFKGKYNCLPGDCPDAGALGFNDQTSGNGNGSIGLSAIGDFQSTTYIAANILEHLHYWYHLGEANLIHYRFPPATEAWTDLFPTSAGGRFSPPASVVSRRGITIYGGQGGWFVQSDIYFDSSGNNAHLSQHVFLLGSFVPFGLAPPASLPFMGAYMPSDMQAIDQKMDDGLPLSGIARVWAGFNISNTQISYTITSGAGGTGSDVCVQNDSQPFQYNVRYTAGALNGLCNLAIKATF